MLDEHEVTILQKLIRQEQSDVLALPYLDEGYFRILKDLYLKVGNGKDYWKND